MNIHHCLSSRMLLALLVLLASAGCEREVEPAAAAPEDAAALVAESPVSNNRLHLLVRGDYEADLSFEGSDVSGSLITGTNGSFTFRLSAQALGDRQEFFSLGSVAPLLPEPGLRQRFVPERRGAQFSMAVGGAVHEANQGNARNYFDTDAGGADTATEVVLDRIEQIPSPDPGVAWWRYEGHFTSTVAWVPDPPTKTCMAEAEQHPGRLPQYQAELCGARRMDLAGVFVLVQESPATAR